MNTISTHPSKRFGLGLGVILLLGLASACASDHDDLTFRGDDHEMTGTDTGKVDTGEDTHGDTHGDTGDKDVCPRTQGYWKNWNVYARQENRQIPWPIDEDTMLCGMTWFEWLWTPPRGDAWIILVHQWIAASLNVAAGVDAPAEVDAALAEAAELLADCEISPAERDEAIALSELLDAFNNGQFTESCDDDDDGGDGADGVD